MNIGKESETKSKANYNVLINQNTLPVSIVYLQIRNNGWKNKGSMRNHVWNGLGTITKYI